MICVSGLKVVIFSVFVCVHVASQTVDVNDGELVCHQKGDDCALKSELLQAAESETGKLYWTYKIFYFVL